MKTLDEIVDDITKRMGDPSAIGLATHRHFPQEELIYDRFGSCGFSIDVITAEEGRRRTSYILVRADADSMQEEAEKIFEASPGKVRYSVCEQAGEEAGCTTVVATYENKKELFAAAQRVREAFYEKYGELKEIARRKAPVVDISAEIFHEVGIEPGDLLLGV